MRILTVIESSEATLALADREAAALQGFGRRLAGSSRWWGQDAEVSTPDRSVIRCVPRDDGRWRVRVSDAVGVLVVGDLEIIVEPKIPKSHLLYLLTIGGYLPRLDSSNTGHLEAQSSLWDLVATWFLGTLESVLRAELIRDYQPVRSSLPMLRGRIDPFTTSRDFYRGRLGLTCEFEDFNADSPLNRLLKAAARYILMAPALHSNLRRRASRALARMDGVGDLRPGDELSVVIDRRIRHYQPALMLAQHVLRRQGRTLEAGELPVWSFLLRTPEPVEAGLRELLRRHLPGSNVRKSGLTLTGSSMTLNPDIVLGAPSAVGDVKYKWANREWDRPDLYQLVAFATGYRVKTAALFSFAPSTVESPVQLMVGETHITAVPWIATKDWDPVRAGEDFVARARNWLEDSKHSAGVDSST